jgi:Salmonella virulence plasmid 65kDa B protein
MRVLVDARRAARLATLACFALVPPLVDPVQAQESPSEAPSPAQGGFTQSIPQAQPSSSEASSLVQGGFTQAIPIEVPAYRGVQPQLELAYSSERRNGFVGVGWGLSGLSVLMRTKGGRGIPRFDSGDVFLLDGQELLPCATGIVSPSCTAGGSHATKDESYLRIKFDAGTNQWTVWGQDGTRTVLSAIQTTSRGTLRWGQSTTADTHGNTATYGWSCGDGDCYPESIGFGPYVVRLYREVRPDVTTFATGEVGALGRTAHRLRTVLVSRGSQAIRAYGLTYVPSPGTGRSMLVSVQQFGTDVTVSGGVITGGTALPARRFRYQGGTTGEVFPAGSGE